MWLEGNAKIVSAGMRLDSLRLFARFALVGLLNTAFGYAAFAALCLVGLRPVAALVGSTAAGVAFNFQTSQRLVFRTRGRSLRFVMVYVPLFLVNWGALRLMRSAGLTPIEAQGILALPMAVLSFIGQKLLVFPG